MVEEAESFGSGTSDPPGDWEQVSASLPPTPTRAELEKASEDLSATIQRMKLQEKKGKTQAAGNIDQAKNLKKESDPQEEENSGRNNSASEDLLSKVRDGRTMIIVKNNDETAKEEKDGVAVAPGDCPEVVKEHVKDDTDVAKANAPEGEQESKSSNANNTGNTQGADIEVKLQRIRNRITRLENRVDNVSQTNTDTVNDMENKMQVLRNQINIGAFCVDTKVQKLERKKLDEEEEESVENVEEKLKRIRNRIGKVENQVKNANQVAASSMELHETTGKKLQDLEDKITHLETCLTASNPEEYFSSGDFAFASVDQVRQFLEANEVPSVGIYVDLFTAFINMDHSSPWGGSEAVPSIFPSGAAFLENRLVDAMMSPQGPPLLYYDKAEGYWADPEEGFAPNLSYDFWIGKGSMRTAYRRTLRDMFRGYCNGLEGALPASRGENPAHALAWHLLDNIKEQFSAFTYFVDDLCQELMHNGNFSRKKAFVLVGRCSRVIWEAMQPYRQHVALQGASAHKAEMLWAVLQCHRVMDEFIKTDFRSHPAILHEMTHFMLQERIDREQVDTLTAELKESNQTICELRHNFDSLAEEHKLLRQKFDELAGQVQSINRKLEDPEY